MKLLKFTLFIIFVGLSSISLDANALSIPGPADAGRVDKELKTVTPEDSTGTAPSTSIQGVNAPSDAENIKFILKKVNIKGVTTFSKEEIESIYQKYIGQEITADTIWKIADLITKRYHDSGYFLSRAYVPQQKIDSEITIAVGEGYIAEVELDDPAIEENPIVSSLISRLKESRASRAQDIEGALLRLNDIPGISFRSVLQPIPGRSGAVKLYLYKQDKPGAGTVNFDNFNSPYLGPYEGAISYERSILPFQQTSFYLLGGVPLDKLKFFSVNHKIPLTPEISMQVYGGHTQANPGFTLSSSDIESSSNNLGISISNQIIRHRAENLAATLSFDGRNSNSDILGAPLSRDRVRAVRANISYDTDDTFSGYNFLNLTLSQGTKIFGANNKEDVFVSRAGANPTFTKLEYSLTRFQKLLSSFIGVAAVSGQLASSTLYSSEQFGYGGQAFGRAYNPSEIIGDSGIAGLFELRYENIPVYDEISISPYGFYDIGKIWNKVEDSASGSSAGLGVRVQHNSGVMVNMLAAQPLTREIEAPPVGNGKNARFLFQISYKF